ncbi:MAG TPA: HDOD domain-containing protein [Bacteroidota bacterium]|nr:HDOD domain-containing protein [Bacteroidota bacterium]
MAKAGQLEILDTLVFLDDEESVLEGVRSAFKSEAYDLNCFSKGEDALLFMKQHPVDIVVSDLRMPGMSGLEFMNFSAHIAPEAIRILTGSADDKGIGLVTISKELTHQFLQKPWTDQKLRMTIHDTLQARSESRTKEVQTLLTSFTELPSAPQFHDRLNGLLKNDEKYLRLIIDEIEKNPALVAKLLRTANSVFFGARKNISNVNDAVRYIGVEYVAGLVVAIESYYQVCVQTSDELTGFMEEVWDESLKRAELSKIIATQWEAKCEPRLVYITSLLQDVGYVARMCDNPTMYKRFKSLSNIEESKKYEIEMHLYTCTHDDLAAALLKSWNFPPTIPSAIKKHHRMTGDDVVAQIIQVATVLMNKQFEVPHDPTLDPVIEEYERRLMDVPEQYPKRT